MSSVSPALRDPGGWVVQFAGGHLGHGGALVLALGAVAVFAWVTQDRISPTRRDRAGDWWVYLCSGVGLLYLVLLAPQAGLLFSIPQSAPGSRRTVRSLRA